jgi:hypothetical protein
MTKKLIFLLFIGLLMVFGCRKEDAFATGNLDLRFSTDTVYLDTVFSTIGSSTYQLKVYNDADDPVRINNIRLENPASFFRVNVNGTPTTTINDVEILANDSIYIFIEVTAAIQSSAEMLVTDKLLFSDNNNVASVDLVTLAQNAIFHKPTNFLLLGAAENPTVIPYSIIDCNTTWDASLPHVVYGYAVVDSACSLTLQPGVNVHFHNNSGLWVFNDAQLNVAVGAFPGQGDSVTFSSDRLEPGFEDAPGQWGGVLGGVYLSQRARANINNLVLKNATTGLRTDSAVFTDQLMLTNSYILNCSRTGFFAGYSAVEASNLVIANTGLYGFYAFGGNYDFKHCTFANFWSGSTRQEPAVLLTNFLEFNDANGQVQRIVRNVESAYFGNCVIDGNNRQEIAIAKDEGGLLAFQFNHALLKVEPDAEDRGFDINGPEFTNVNINQLAGFVDPSINNYQLDSLSQLINIGNPTDAFLLNSDIIGRGRNFGSLPDLGAFERQF